MNYYEQYRAALLPAIDAIDGNRVDQIIDLFRKTRDAGRHIFVFGNGGSAASASHFVCDMIKGASLSGPKRFKIMALSDQLPTLTAYGNDSGYENVFVEPLKNFAEPGDVAMALSGSGNSPNVIKAIEYAKSVGCKTVGLSGRDGGKLGPMVDLNLHVPVPHMGRIEDAHMIVCHMICYYFMEHAD